jgi:hypothetical protein
VAITLYCYLAELSCPFARLLLFFRRLFLIQALSSAPREFPKFSDHQIEFIGADPAERVDPNQARVTSAAGVRSHLLLMRC